MDVEGHLYTHMKNQGITLITVSHRDTLWKYHDYLLKFKGDKQYEFIEMPKEKRVWKNINLFIKGRKKDDVFSVKIQ